MKVYIVAARTGSLVDLFAFGIEDFVATACIGHCAVFTIDCDEADLFSAARVTTAAVPHSALAAEVKSGAAGVGRFLIVVKMVAATAKGHTLGIIDTERPARCVQRMDAVVADFAIAPMPAPMPVVM